MGNGKSAKINFSDWRDIDSRIEITVLPDKKPKPIALLA